MRVEKGGKVGEVGERGERGGGRRERPSACNVSLLQCLKTPPLTNCVSSVPEQINTETAIALTQRTKR